MLRGNPSSWMVDAIISQPYLDVDEEKGWKGLLEYQSWLHPLLLGAGQDALCTPSLRISDQTPHTIACSKSDTLMGATYPCYAARQWPGQQGHPTLLHTVKAAGAAPAVHKPMGQIHVNFCQIPLNLRQLLPWAKAAMRWGTQSKLD